MFTESQIGWLRSLVKRGLTHEKPRWNLLEMMVSAGGALFLGGGLSLLTTTFDVTTQQKFIIALWIITTGGGITGIVGLLINLSENKRYMSCLEEMDTILEKKENVINGQDKSHPNSGG